MLVLAAVCSSTASARRSRSASSPKPGDRTASTSASSRTTPSACILCVCLVVIDPSSHLDIKVKEPDFKELMKGRTVYLPPRFMTCNQAIDELLEVEEKHGKGGTDERVREG